VRGVTGEIPTQSSVRGPSVHGASGSAGVAAGSALTADAARRMLQEGGTAVDAVVAGAFAATVAEPTLASLGGGGFCLIAEPDREPEVLDFFVDMPGRGGDGRSSRMESLSVTFASDAVQDFEAGWGSVAVPGTFAGLLDLHARGGRLPLADVLAPTIAAARDGIVLDDVQVQFIRVIGPILMLTPASAELFTPPLHGRPFHNPEYAELLTLVADGRLTDSDYADPLVAAVDQGGGLLTIEDVRAYSVVARRPIGMRRDRSWIWTNPPPAFGGAIVLETLGLVPEMDHPWPRIADAIVRATRRHRGAVNRGTTHISVIDAEGRAASLSLSNGSNSGAAVRGVTLNNMLGEADLNPGGWHALPPGARLSSMMAPTLVRGDDGSTTVLGTGGSERIRSALVQTLVRMLDQEDDLADAIQAPRLHATEALIDLEPGFISDAWQWTPGLPPVREWPSPDLYFGGVHAVRREADGTITAVGDRRRGGAIAVL
jgi:gamma-glutamyltranspeptidase / glutathione hydrolase